MNGIIMGLYEIEEQAGKLMEEAAARREELLEENRRKMEDSALELEQEMEGRLSILLSQLEEQNRKSASLWQRTRRRLPCWTKHTGNICRRLPSRLSGR